MRSPLFVDRAEAGLALARALEHYRGSDALVVAIPRGGVAVGHALAGELGLPLDVVLAKKIGHPMNREFAIGAATLDDHVVDEHADVPERYVREEVDRIRQQMRQRSVLYRGERPPPVLRDRTVIVVDDGVATGHTLLATIDLLRKAKPRWIVVAMPVVPPSFVQKGRERADEFVHLMAPADFMGVGQFYENFSTVDDEDVVHLMNDAWKNEHR
jgi:predicted phosphoribosyltransferase